VGPSTVFTFAGIRFRLPVSTDASQNYLVAVGSPKIFINFVPEPSGELMGKYQIQVKDRVLCIIETRTYTAYSLVPQATYEFLNRQNWEWRNNALEPKNVNQPYF
jgi:hypothetical protein